MVALKRAVFVFFGLSFHPLQCFTIAVKDTSWPASSPKTPILCWRYKTPADQDTCSLSAPLGYECRTHTSNDQRTRRGLLKLKIVQKKDNLHIFFNKKQTKQPFSELPIITKESFLQIVLIQNLSTRNTVPYSSYLH